MPLFHPCMPSETFQLVNIPVHNHQRFLFPGKQGWGIFQQVVLSREGNSVQQLCEEGLDELGFPPHGSICTPPQRLFLKLFQ